MRVMAVRFPDWPAERPFESAAAAVETQAAGVEVVRPSLLALAARGPARFHRGEEAAAERIVDAVADMCDAECLVGIAEGLFAAWLAAHTGVLVPSEDTERFVHAHDVSCLGRAELVVTLRRLGVDTLGDFAALPSAAVADRFGAEGVFAQRLARGQDPRPPTPRVRPPDLTVRLDCDPPLERVDAAAFAARELAEQVRRRLDAHGLACSRLTIEAFTAEGAQCVRDWRGAGALSNQAVSDRVQWQLHGWLDAGGHGAVVALQLRPRGLMPADQAQPSLWGDVDVGRAAADRAAAQLQGLLGTQAVAAATRHGGRGLAERARLAGWGQPSPSGKPKDRPWPGAAPSPQPSVLLAEPAPALLHDCAGSPVDVSGRAMLSAAPAAVTLDGVEIAVTGWAGPWPVDEGWWRGDQARRYARLQLRLADERCLLLVIESGQWQVEAWYD